MFMSLGKVLCVVKYAESTKFKGTVAVTSSDSDMLIARFTTVPFKPCSNQLCRRYLRLKNYFIDF